VEQRHVEIVTTVKAVVTVPVAVKLSPYFSSPGEMALRLDRVGVDGLVLFNRFIQPDIDPEGLTVTVGFGLSSPSEGRLPRAWIARLTGRVTASLAASTGVDDAADVAAYLLAGADVVMTTSALLRRGPGYAATMLDGLQAWMERKGFTSLDSVRGKLAAPADTTGSAYQRAGYLTTPTRGTSRGRRPLASQAALSRRPGSPGAARPGGAGPRRRSAPAHPRR
jgi:dihydroorotate dehydrogenase (fumarate)